jgi:putative membrane-bound dehydrogenase-like protein
MVRGWALLAFLTVFTIPGFAQREFGFDNTKPSGQPYLPAEETVRRMKVADGFEVRLFAAEPMVVNPIAFTIDEKGRVWVVECFEYPKRTPKGQMPRDRIVILEDTDGDGRCDKRTVFAEGKDFPVPFDLASGIEVGYGGVFLGAPPYLWFIENKNDKPGRFEILLKGFGSHDTHETLNTFQWGPDGWLYGLHGVFTYSEVVPADGVSTPPVRMNAAVWRYHPRSRKFEIFSEGTSNPWGMDWRNTDGEFILCCCVIPHLYHMVPGGIYRRQAGASFNPYAYGELQEICDHTFHRESGWAHAGLISLDAPHIPAPYRNSVIFGSIHGCSIKQNILARRGSTFLAQRGEDFLVSGDKNFRPLNMKWGPNGEIFLSDWHDQNPCHQAKPDDWDYERGRIYRIVPSTITTKKAADLSALTDDELIARTLDPNPYVARQSLRLVYERGVRRDMVAPKTPRFQSWAEVRQWQAIVGDGRFDTALVEGNNAVALAWLARFVGEQDTMADTTYAQLLRAIAPRLEKPLPMHAVLRREIASLALRFVGKRDVTGLLHQLMLSVEDAHDLVIPHLTWLAYEQVIAKASPAIMDAELAWLKTQCRYIPATGRRPASIPSPMVTEYIVPRLMRRLIAADRADFRDRCVDFLLSLTETASPARKPALEAMALALQDQVVDQPSGWGELRQKLLEDPDETIRRLVNQLDVSFRDPEAMKRAFLTAQDKTKEPTERALAVRQVALLRHPEASALLLNLARGSEPLMIRVEAMRSLSLVKDPKLAENILKGWSAYPREVRLEAANVLASRRESARALLHAVSQNIVAREDLSDNTILRIRAFNDHQLNEQVERVWGRFRATPKELEALIARMRQSLDQGSGSWQRGQQVFDQHCAKCHRFDGRGADVGPALDGAARDIEYLLANILDPNRVIGAPYFVHVIERKDGTTEVGLRVAEDPQRITLRVENGVEKIIAKADIESHTIQEKSMMPEGLAAGMSEQDFRDLIRYVMAHPFVPHVTIDGMSVDVGVTGRIMFPASANGVTTKISSQIEAPKRLRTRLLVGGVGRFEIRLNGSVVGNEELRENRADEKSFDVELQSGRNQLEVAAQPSKQPGAIYLRFLDPDRLLRYPEFK